jgi:hypothetical protein
MKQLLCILAVGAMLSSPLSAGVLTLSNASSDETDPALLDATLRFEVISQSTLELTITNQTTDPNGYQITAVYFNVAPEVGALTLNTLPLGFENWELVAAEPPGNPLQVGPFGTFDYVLQWSGGGGGIDINALDYPPPENEVTFTIDIGPGGSVEQDDFVKQLSDPSGNNPPAYAAAHFQDGPGGDSAFGAVIIPEASSILAFAMVGSLLGVVHFRRRRP